MQPNKLNVYEVFLILHDSRVSNFSVDIELWWMGTVSFTLLEKSAGYLQLCILAFWMPYVDKIVKTIHSQGKLQH